MEKLSFLYKKHKIFICFSLVASLFVLFSKLSYLGDKSLFIDELMMWNQSTFHFKKLFHYISNFSFTPIIYFIILKIPSVFANSLVLAQIVSISIHILTALLFSLFVRENTKKIQIFLLIILNCYLNAYSMLITSYIFSIFCMTLFLYNYQKDSVATKTKIVLFIICLYSNYLVGAFAFSLIVFEMLSERTRFKVIDYLIVIFSIIPLFFISPLKFLFINRNLNIGTGYKTIANSMPNEEFFMILLSAIPFLIIFLLYIYGICRNRFKNLMKQDLVFIGFILFLFIFLVVFKQIYIRYFVLLLPYVIFRIVKLELIREALVVSLLSFFLTSPHNVSYFDTQKINKLFKHPIIEETREENLKILTYNIMWYRYYLNKINKNLDKMYGIPLNTSAADLSSILVDGKIVFCVKYECPITIKTFQDKEGVQWIEGKDYIILKSKSYE